jgi:sporulation delaying protein B
VGFGRWERHDAEPRHSAERRVLSRIGSALASRLAAAPPWSNVYGVARSLLALGTAGTLIASSPQTLFRPAVGAPLPPHCAGPATASIFCVGRDQLALAQFVAVLILLVAASGWRPRVTAIPQWWVSASFAASSTLPDGGDQVTAILTLLMMPIALLDPRPWHWGAPPRLDGTMRSLVVAAISGSAAVAIRVQVAGIYLHSSLGKLGVPEWIDGSAFYYWSHDPFFGLPGWLRPIVDPVVLTPAGAAFTTWGPVALEFALAIALVLDRRWWAPLLVVGLGFHLGIGLMMGLPSFALAMCAALIVYLRPAGRPFHLALPWSAMPRRIRLRTVGSARA